MLFSVIDVNDPLADKLNSMDDVDRWDNDVLDVLTRISKRRKSFITNLTIIFTRLTIREMPGFKEATREWFR